GSKTKYSTSQLLNYSRDSYFERTSRPVYAIFFLLPFIIFYELGTIFINTDMLSLSQVRVVSFVWLQQFLSSIGFSVRFSWMAPPLAVIIILLGLQLASRKRWYFSLRDVFPMAFECVLYAIPLIVFGLLLNSSSASQQERALFSGDGLSICAQVSEAVAAPGRSVLAEIVTGIGAGIYEELVFRLVLICILMIIFQNVLRFEHRRSIIFSVIVSAVLFSAHHHIVFLNGQLSQSEPFVLAKFVFRTIAGVYFAVLFAVRGFGITAGTHAFYDIIAVIVNAVFFHG
ncbi:CPBP family intramembrane glutamic endopeptidase, partial [Planctomycetota bacterium]